MRKRNSQHRGDWDIIDAHLGVVSPRGHLNSEARSQYISGGHRFVVDSATEHSDRVERMLQLEKGLMDALKLHVDSKN